MDFGCGKEFSLGLWQPFRLHETKWHCYPGLPPAWASNPALLRPTCTFHEAFPKGAFLPVHPHLWPQSLPLSSRVCGASRRQERSSLEGMCQGGFSFLTRLLASFSLNVVSLRLNGVDETCDVFFTFSIHHFHGCLLPTSFTPERVSDNCPAFGDIVSTVWNSARGMGAQGT